MFTNHDPLCLEWKDPPTNIILTPNTNYQQLKNQQLLNWWNFTEKKVLSATSAREDQTLHQKKVINEMEPSKNRKVYKKWTCFIYREKVENLDLFDWFPSLLQYTFNTRIVYIDLI